MAFDGRAKYMALVALSLVYFLLSACTFNGLGVVLPYMVGELGWNWATAGLGFTLLGMTCGLSGLLPALLIRRIGVARTVLLGGGVMMAGFASLALTHSAAVYYLGTTLLGLGYSLCGTVPGLHVISHSFENRASTAIGIYFTAGGLGSVFGPLLVYATQELTDSWRLYWAAAAGAAMLFGLLAAFATAASRARPAGAVETGAAGAAEEGGWPARAALRTPHYYVIVAAYSVFLLINTTLHGFAVQHLVESGLGMGAAAAAMSAVALVGAVGSTVAGIAGEKIGSRHLTMASLGGLTIGTAALATGASGPAVIIFVAGLGIGVGFSYVSTAKLLLDYFGKKANLELYSIMTLISTVAAVGPAAGGVLRDRVGSFMPVFLICTALGLALMLVLLWLRRPDRHLQPQAHPAAA